MSLNDAERRRTAAELRQALDRSGLGLDEVAADLSMTRDRVTRVLNVASAESVDVWQLRDYLQQAIADQGFETVRFTVLTESSRTAARQWFRLRAAPRHTFVRS
jgi:hypothetical protein